MSIREIKNLIKEAIDREFLKMYRENSDSVGIDQITGDVRLLPLDRTSPVKIQLKPLNKSDMWERPMYQNINTNKIYVDINLGQGEPEIYDVTDEGEPNTPLNKGRYEIVSENKLDFDRFIKECITEVLHEGRSESRLTIEDRKKLDALFASNYLKNNATFVYIPPARKGAKINLPTGYIQVPHYSSLLEKPVQLLNNRGFKLGGYTINKIEKRESLRIPGKIFNVTRIVRPLFRKITEEEGYFIVRNCQFGCIIVQDEKDGIIYFKINAYIQPTN